MKNKKRLALVAGVLMTMSLSAGAAVLSGCGESEDPNIKIETENLKATYFADFGSNEYDVVFDGGQLTFSVAGDSRTGTFKYDGTNLKLTFADNGEEIAATLTDGKLTFTYKDVNYEMVEKKEFTVTFNAGGSNTTQEVVVGRTVSKPADPVKADNIFLGWYEDSAFTKAFSFDTKITEDTTVYARFVSSISTQQEFKISLDANYDGASAIAPVTTVNGHVYNLPTPARSGEKFLGWWVSDYNSSDKLTTKWDETYVFGANATLFAVWESDAPAVSVKSDGVSWTAKGVGNSYVVEIFDKNGAFIDDYRGGTTVFKFDFSALAAGEYTVKVTLGNKSTVAYYKNKALAPVSIFEVEGNVLKFNTVKGAQKYLVTAVCGDGTHDHTEKEVPANAFDFSDCVMVKGGIKFTVKAVADGMLSSVSEEYPVERNLDAASLRVDEASGKLVWDAVEHATAYTLKINDGTTVKTINNLTSTEYSIKDLTGNLSFTVIPSAHGYNSPDESAWTYNKASLPVPKNIRVYSDRVEWDPVDGATGYTVKIGGKVLPVTGTSAPIDVADFGGNTSVSFSVMATGASADKNSLYTDDLTLTTLLGNDSVIFADGLVKWDAVIGATHYGISVNDGEEILVNATETSYEVILTKAGVNEIKVRSITGGTPSAAITVYAQASTVTFDANGGVSVDPAYVSDGGKIYLPSGATRYGYDFAGWYSSAEGGVQCVDGAIKNGSDDITYYARWTAQSFKITVDAGDNGEFVGEDVQTQFDVAFDSDFELPILDSKDPTKVFGGWTVNSVQYTDDLGASVINWNIASDTTLTPVWINEVFVFKSVSGGREYSVAQGKNIKAKKMARIKVPASYNGKPVTTIGGDAFKNCSDLKIIEIPDTITGITMGNLGPNSDGSAFYSCNSLTSIHVYSTGTTQDVRYSDEDGVLLYNNDKSGNRELVVYPKAREGGFIIPDGVEIIPIGTFKGCTNLTSLSIPASVTMIEDEAFSGCTKLETIEFRSAGTGETAAELQFGENVFSIYSGCKLKEITLPSRLKVNGNADLTKIFKGNSTIEKIHMESGSALSDIDGVVCSGSKIIYCPKARKGDYIVPSGISEIDAKAFEGCSSISKLTVPYSLRKIGAEAFSGCSGILSIDFRISKEELDQGASLEIGRKAFYGCSGLNDVTLPMHLTKLDAFAFGNISSLTKVKIECAGDVDLVDGAFAKEITGGGIGESYITDIEIGANVKEFAISGAFGVKIANLTVDPANQSFEAYDGVLFNKGKTSIVYYPISKEGNYVIPSTVEVIGGRVFEGKLGLTSIEISGNVTDIGANAFKDCKALETVTFEGNRIKSLTIGAGAFEGCTGIKTLTLPNRADAAAADVAFTIGARAFYGCKFENLVVPEGFTEIGHIAFGNTHIKNAYLPASLKKIAEWCKPERDLTTGEEIAGTGTLTEGTGTDKGKWYYDSSKKNIANIYTVSIFDGERGRLPTPSGSISMQMLETITVASGNANYGSKDNVLYKKNGNGDFDVLLLSAFKNVGVGEEGKVEIPATVTKVTDYAFYNSDMKLVEFLPSDDANHKVEFGEGVFGFCDKLTKITLPRGMTKIGEKMFYMNGVLEEIVISNTVTEIGLGAFRSCSKLWNVQFEPGGTSPLVISDGKSSSDQGGSYSDGAFASCSSLKTITLPERTQKIGSYTFAYNAYLETVNLPATLETVGKGAFAGCPRLGTVKFTDGEFKEDGTAKVNLVIDADAFKSSGLQNVTLPANLKSIGANAFNATAISSISIPAYTDTIGSAAFTDCRQLLTVTFAKDSKLATMNTNVFSGCWALNSINIEKCTSLATISDNTFQNCKTLASIKLPNSLETLGASAFSGCTSLTSVSFDTKENGKCSIKNINNFAFQSTGMSGFTFPESASDITLGTRLFDSCPNFTEVTLSSSVKSVGAAFAQCKTLTTIIIPDSNTDLQSRDKLILNVKKDEQGNVVLDEQGNRIGTEIQMAYAAVDTTTDSDGKGGVYRIPEGITSIGANAFAGQNNIRKLILPASVTTIGDEAFRACRMLEEVDIPGDSSLQSIGEKAFKHCHSLKTINIENAKKLTTVKQYAFDQCLSLQTISMPDSLVNIGSYAFQYCWSLHTVRVSKFNVGTDGATNKAVSMFKNCLKLKNVTFADGIEWLSEYMFVESGIEEITVPASVKFMGDYADTGYSSPFQDCKLLRKVIIKSAESLTTGQYVFSGCAELEEVILPNITGFNIFQKAFFYNCPKIKTVKYFDITSSGEGAAKTYTYTEVGTDGVITLPNCIKTVGESAFYNCEKVTKIVLPASVETLGGSVFSGCTQLSTVQYSSDGVTLSGTAGEVTLPNTVTAIGSSLFLNCTSITKAKIPAIELNYTSTTIPAASMFSGCTELLEAEYLITCKYTGTSKSTVLDVQIGGSIFIGCEKLTTVLLNGAVQKIGASLFQGCTKLTTVKYRDSEGNDVGADGVVTMPSFIYSIGSYTFVGCASVTEIDFRGLRPLVAADGIKKVNGQTATASLSLGNNMFSGCVKLKSVLLNKLTNTFKASSNALFAAATVSSVKYEACTALTTIKYFDASLTDDTATADVDERIVGDDDCITLPNVGSNWWAFAGCTGIKAFDFRDLAINNIPKGQFVGFENLERVVLNQSMVTINQNAFDGCAKLKTIQYYDSSKVSGKVVGVVGNLGEATFAPKSITIKERAFYGTGIVKLDLSKVTGLTFTIATSGASGEFFANCPNLTTVILGDKITKLDKSNMFTDCAKLKTVKYYDTAAKTVVGADNVATFAPTMANFGFNAFKGTGIITVDLSNIAAPENIYFNNNVFNSCPDLTTAIFNEKFTKLGGWMFGGCAKLTTVKYIDTTKTDNPETADVDERMVGEDGVVTLPAGLIDVASNAFVNCTGITKVDLSGLSGALTAGQSTFNGCENLQTVILGNGFTKFVGWMFQNCTSLSTVQWRDADGATLHGEAGKATFNPAFKGVNAGQYNPFNGCSSITEIDLSAVTGQLEGAGIFYLCKSLTKVTLGENMTVLPQSVFEMCELLSDIDISNITSFGNQAFMGCAALTQVTLNDEITELSVNLFKDSGLTSVTLPAALETVSAGAFDGSAITAITLPDGVTVIGDYAFANTAISAIVLNEGITKIGANAFADTAISSIELPESLSYLGAYAFAGTGLTEVTLNSGLGTLGTGAFAGTQITELTVPVTVTDLGIDIFSGEVTLAEGSSFSKDENGVIFRALADDKVYISYIPADLQCEEYVLTANHVIAVGALSGRTGIKKLVVPVESLLNGVFTVDMLDGYEGAVEITGLPETIDKASVTALSGALNGYVFKTLVLGEGVKVIGDSAFMDFTGAEEIVLPSTVTSIGSKALYKNETVKKINIPVNVKLMGGTTKNWYAFEKAVGLEEVVYEAEELDMTDARTFNYNTFSGCSSLRKVTIGSKVKMLPDNTFKGLTAIETVTINSNVLSKLPTGAFSGCTALNSVTLPSTITEIGSSAFNGTAISGALDLSSVTSIGANAFENCAAITSVTLGEGLTEIGGSAFKGTAISGEFDLSSVSSIGASAFENLAGITSVTFGSEGVTLGNSAFKGTSLSGALDLSGVVSIGNNTFENLTGITSVTFGNEGVTLGDSAFKGTSLSGALDLSGVMTIGKNTFEALTGITSITLGEGLTAIGASAFKGTGISSVVLPSTVTDVGSSVFENCANLLTADFSACTFVLSSGLSTLKGDAIFRNCTALTSVTLPDTLEFLDGDYIFDNCKSLTNIVIPASVCQAYAAEFQGWTSAQTITIKVFALSSVYNWNSNVVFKNCEAKIEFVVVSDAPVSAD